MYNFVFYIVDKMNCFIEVLEYNLKNCDNVKSTFGLYNYNEICANINNGSIIKRTGNGIIILLHDLYYVVTCYHIIGNNYNSIEIIINNNKYNTEYVGSFSLLDICLLKILDYKNDFVIDKCNKYDKYIKTISSNEGDIYIYNVINTDIIYRHPFFDNRTNIYNFPFTCLTLEEQINDPHGLSGSGYYINNEINGMIYKCLTKINSIDSKHFLIAIPYNIILLYVDRIINNNIMLYSLKVHDFSIAMYQNNKTQQIYYGIMLMNKNYNDVIIKVNNICFDEKGKINVVIKNETYNVYLDVYIMLNNFISFNINYVRQTNNTERLNTITKYSLLHNENIKYLCCNGYIFKQLTLNRYHIYGLNNIGEQKIEEINIKEIINDSIIQKSITPTNIINILYQKILKKKLSKQD